jgi:hypothetical protein
MAGHALPFVEDLDDRAADADIHLLSDRPEQHGVPRAVDLDVVIRRDAGAFPAGERVGHLRPGRLKKRNYMSSALLLVDEMGYDRAGRQWQAVSAPAGLLAAVPKSTRSG